ncbi:ATP-binding protein [Pendulispora albinea]|uniref:histidine kinase n=1 Tax=Pendulispora albinea TaxID=2741071 RepID=A0ABZ2LMC3_9BACT
MSSTIAEIGREFRNPRVAHEAQNHSVFFYEDEALLSESVSNFIGAGLSAGDPIHVVATPEHRRIIRERLESSTPDLQSALQSGLLTMADARETLSLFMVNGMPDAARFAAVVEPILRARPGARMHVYGEMVDLLCRDGRPEAAIQLEKLWNELAVRHSFSLFCAYVMDTFSGAKSSLYESVCEAHTHAHPVRGESETHMRLRTIAGLRQRARVLEAEVERSKHSDVFRLLVESLTDYAIFMLDPTGIVSSWNGGAERIKGYAAHEIIGQHVSTFYPPETRETGKIEKALEIARREGRFEEEGWRIRKDGSRFWASVILSALRSQSNGELVGVAMVTRDLTERRNAEQERIRLAQVEESMRVKDAFLATISHELRTPLNAIHGWSCILQEERNGSVLSKGLETIRRNAEAQIKLVDDLLDMSRIIAGKMRIEAKVADMVAIVRDALEGVRPGAHAKNIELVLDCPEHPMALVGDPVRLQQVAWNFISNAVKFTGQGGTVSIRLRREGAIIELTVSDTGRGVEPEFLPYIFEPFRQADSSATRRVGGLGLGLAIAKQIVELHGGQVAATSAGAGQGTTFTAMFPVRAVVPMGAIPAVPGEASPQGSLRLDGVRVLVVDDEPDARELLRALLQKRGAVVRLAGSAPEGRHAVEWFRPHVIVSDVGMPDEDGYQFLRSIRAMSREMGGGTPAIALSAYAYPEDRRRALLAGYTNHLAKPVDHEELLDTVHNLANVGATPWARTLVR